MLTPCLDCGRPSRGSRCPAHEAVIRRAYHGSYPSRRAAAIRAEPWCHRPGGCPHPDAGTRANPLTADHTTPVVRGGASSSLLVVCLRCNHSRQDREWSLGRGADAPRERPGRPQGTPAPSPHHLRAISEP